MKGKVRQGFTLVEVALFLAITGLLFVGIVVGIQNSMFQQKFNDSVQSFAEFLRSVYSQTMNVENINTNNSGRSSKAIYGKLVTFGESKNLEGQDNVDNAIFSYTVVGDIDDSFGTSDTLGELKNLNANVFASEGEERYDFAGIAEQYFTRWDAAIETTKGWEYENYKGALLVVRHPKSGTVFTYVLDNTTIEVNQALLDGGLSNPLIGYLGEGGFQSKDADYCVDPDGNTRPSMRRNVRIKMGARNASGVEIIGQNAEDNKCEQ